MGERTKHHDFGSESASFAGPGGDNLDSIRERVSRTVAAGDAAVNRCISGNSEKYLSDGRQATGE